VDLQASVRQRFDGETKYNVHLAAFLRGKCVQGLGSEGCLGLEDQVPVALHRLESFTRIHHQLEFFRCDFVGLFEDLELSLRFKHESLVMGFMSLPKLPIYLSS
jgi:hypothetical protein